MLGYELQQAQHDSQLQVQRMSQLQIYSLNLLAMGNQDLRNEIYSAVEKNPALEVAGEPISGGAEPSARGSTGPADYTRIGSASAAGQLKSDNFQAAIESRPDERETLREHLLGQLHVMKLSDDMTDLCTRLIENLDKNGFHCIAPVSLLDPSRPAQTPELLEQCIRIVQMMDPAGVCCKDYKESLLVQAQLRAPVPPAALFILDGHFDFLDPPVAARVLKRIQTWVKEQQKLAFVTEQEAAAARTASGFTAQDIEHAITFIRSLDPYPAQQFGTDGTVYVEPDVYVEKLPATGGQQAKFKVTISNASLPKLMLSDSYQDARTFVSEKERKFVDESIRSAKVFIDSLKYRESTIVKACQAIVTRQLPFFEKGPGFLQPLRQKDIADMIGVHETTVSRVANSKFIQCEWGLFPIKYFFTSAVPVGGAAAQEASASAVSKESVMHEIEAILAAQPAGSKPLSDQKLTDQLQAKGIKIARRTVAKYRSLLNISSSFDRS